MKTRFLITLSTLMLLCTSCSISFGHDPSYRHRLLLHFQDTSGNDLLEGIATEAWEELYTLRLVYSEPCMDSYYNHYRYPHIYDPDYVPSCNVLKYEDHYYLMFDVDSSKGKNCPSTARMITLQLTCPHVFGDDNAHEIETYWISINQESPSVLKCYRIAMGDDDAEITYNDLHGYKSIPAATITLDK